MAELISRALTGEATPEELEELQYLGEKYPEEQYFMEMLSEYWNTPGNIPDQEELHSDAHFQHILQSAEETGSLSSESPESATDPAYAEGPARWRPWKLWAAAAAICALIAGGAFYRHLNPSPSPSVFTDQKREVAVKPGAKSRLLLPDGTIVWLNSDSKLTYNSQFTGSFREVALEGEAFFDVAKNPAHPFIVHTRGIDVRVLGTSFDVKSYPREATFEATLIRGKIEVSKTDEPKAQKIVLSPHEKLILDKDADSASAPLAAANEAASDPALYNAKPPVKIVLTPLPVNLPDTSVTETAWMYNKLVFDGESFRSMAVKMERWFNIRIHFEDAQVAAYRFHVTFENETIEQVLHSLQVADAFDYTINNDEVTIRKK